MRMLLSGSSLPLKNWTLFTSSRGLTSNQRSQDCCLSLVHCTRSPFGSRSSDMCAEMHAHNFSRSLYHSERCQMNCWWNALSTLIAFPWKMCGYSNAVSQFVIRANPEHVQLVDITTDCIQDTASVIHASKTSSKPDLRLSNVPHAANVFNARTRFKYF
jgi:hypothetical protein